MKQYAPPGRRHKLYFLVNAVSACSVSRPPLCLGLIGPGLACEVACLQDHLHHEGASARSFLPYRTLSPNPVNSWQSMHFWICTAFTSMRSTPPLVWGTSGLHRVGDPRILGGLHLRHIGTGRSWELPRPALASVCNGVPPHHHGGTEGYVWPHLHLHLPGLAWA